MRKLILFLLLLASPAWAGGVISGAVLSGCSTGGGAAACIDSAHAEKGGSDTTLSIMSGATSDWVATKFVTTAAYSVCKIDLYLTKTGTPTSTVDVYIYTDDGEAGGDADPLELKEGCSLGSFNMASVGGTETTITLSGISGCSLNNATAYWIVLFSNAVSASNYISWNVDNGGATELIKKDDDGTGTWTGYNSFNTGKFELYK